jgi:undecaprenyl phosphate N,N'-diacetylbacillosamine 1-phosphate transferase
LATVGVQDVPALGLPRQRLPSLRRLWALLPDRTGTFWVLFAMATPRVFGPVFAPAAPLRRIRIPGPGEVLAGLDIYFRRTDTWPAWVFGRLSGSCGPSYTTSSRKRIVDLAITVPAAVVVLLLIVLLMAVNRVLYPRRPALFFQDRVGRANAPLRVVKIRSMAPRKNGATDSDGLPVCTVFGRFIRLHYLDEVPQLLQVMTGQLSLVGIRVLPREVYDGLAAVWSPERVESWQSMYGTAPLGLTGYHQAFRTGGKEDRRRFHRDMFYARHASLGFDLYLLWRTLGSRDNQHSSTCRRRVAMTAAGPGALEVMGGGLAKAVKTGRRQNSSLAWEE